jgi:hypothetical protein
LGNDYEIAQIIGCNFHTKLDFDVLSVPSARIDFPLQDKGDAIRNYIIPESRLKKLEPALKESYFEYRFEIEMDINSDGLYQVNVEVNDIPKGSVFLEPVPSKLNEFSKKQIKIYEHLTDLGLPRKLREVHTQKFV